MSLKLPIFKNYAMSMKFYKKSTQSMKCPIYEKTCL